MRSHIFLLSLSALGAVLLIPASLPPVLFPRPGLGKVAERIEVGMTPAQVEAILGGPPAEARTVPRRVFTESFGASLLVVWDAGLVWVGG